MHQRPKEANGKRLGDFEMDLIVDHTYHCGALHQLALHDQTYSWEGVRVVGKSRQTSSVALQEIYQDHHHRQWT